MDNQQTTAFELGWLVAAIDGEGCIGITRRNRKHTFSLKPHVQISNCDKSFIDRILYIYDKLCVPYHVSYMAAKGRRREHWQVTTAGLKRVMKLLPIITDYLCDEKKRKAKLVQEYCKSRLSDWHAAPFTERQLELYSEVANLNVKGRKALSLRDYTRSNRSSKYPNG